LTIVEISDINVARPVDRLSKSAIESDPDDQLHGQRRPSCASEGSPVESAVEKRALWPASLSSFAPVERCHIRQLRSLKAKDAARPHAGHVASHVVAPPNEQIKCRGNVGPAGKI
jgi:hypothetical protein